VGAAVNLVNQNGARVFTDVVAIIPALNEALVIATVVKQLRVAGFSHIIVCDNGSTDSTADEAISAGAMVVHEPRRGYGSACLAALSAIKINEMLINTILFVDGDGSVKADEALALVDKLAEGYDLVVGVRESKQQERHALTWPQRMGNIVACAMIYLIWRVKMRDLGPFRAIRLDALHKLSMQDQQFGWTVEMQVKAIQRGLRYAEIPVTTRLRVGKSKISGTVRGVIGAAIGITSTILKLRYAEWRSPRKVLGMHKVAKAIKEGSF
jgi:glycosyltransferase involved in cell wall biosynthesis